MSDLTARDRELVALGAAMGSNCVPCVEYHIPESRKVGLTDPEIHTAILHADKIRQVPARKTLHAALSLLPAAAGDVLNAAPGDCCSGGASTTAAQAESGSTAQPRDMMAGMMAKMMDTCGSRSQSSGAAGSADKKPAASLTTSKECGCG